MNTYLLFLAIILTFSIAEASENRSGNRDSKVHRNAIEFLFLGASDAEIKHVEECIRTTKMNAGRHPLSRPILRKQIKSMVEAGCSSESIRDRVGASSDGLSYFNALWALKERRDERVSSHATAVVDPKAVAAADAIAAELIAQEAEEEAKTKSGAASGGGAPTPKTSGKKSRK